MKRLYLLVAIFVSACTQSANETLADPHPVIMARYAAFNAKDVEAMKKFEHPDIEVVSHYGAEIDEISGQDNLSRINTDYFSAAPNAKASITNWSYDGDFISVTETLTIPINETYVIDVSEVVYELEDNLIRRIWYYPAEND